MSVIVSTAEQINKSPHNTSSAKFLFSFPKTKRFGDLGRNKSLDKFYSLPDSKSHRSTSFGFGKKYDFTANQRDTPGPNHYALPSFLKRGHQKKAGCSMAPGRNSIKFNSFFINGGLDTPGPTAYCPERKRCTQIGPTLKSRHNMLSSLEKNRQEEPGPGFYNPRSLLNGTGFHVNSKYRSFLPPALYKSPARQELPRSRKRQALSLNASFKSSDSENNNDSFYNTDYLIDHQKSILSNKRSVRAVKIRRPDSRAQKKLLKSDSPGPGEYRLPSDFGHYLARSAMGYKNRLNFSQLPLQRQD